MAAAGASLESTIAPNESPGDSSPAA